MFGHKSDLNVELNFEFESNLDLKIEIEKKRTKKGKGQSQRGPNLPGPANLNPRPIGTRQPRCSCHPDLLRVARGAGMWTQAVSPSHLTPRAFIRSPTGGTSSSDRSSASRTHLGSISVFVGHHRRAGGWDPPRPVDLRGCSNTIAWTQPTRLSPHSWQPCAPKSPFTSSVRSSQVSQFVF